MSTPDTLVEDLIEVIADYSRHGALIRDSWKAMVDTDTHAVHEMGFDFIQVLLWNEAQDHLAKAGEDIQAQVMDFASSENADALTEMLRRNNVHPISALLLGFAINLKFTSSYGDAPCERVTKIIHEALDC